MSGRERQVEEMDESPPSKTRGLASCAGGRCDQAGCRRVRARKRSTMRASVALIAAAGGGEDKADRYDGPTDGKTEEGEDRGRECGDGDETSNRGLGPGCRETHSCLAHRRESKKDGWHEKG